MKPKSIIAIITAAALLSSCQVVTETTTTAPDGTKSYVKATGYDATATAAAASVAGLLINATVPRIIATK